MVQLDRQPAADHLKVTCACLPLLQHVPQGGARLQVPVLLMDVVSVQKTGSRLAAPHPANHALSPATH